MSAHERERLSAYLDDELSPSARDVVEAHLASCKACRDLLAAMAAADEAAAARPVPEPETGYFEDFARRVRTRIEANPVRAAADRRFRPPVWTWAVAALLLLAIVSPLTLRERPAEPQPAASARAAVPPQEAGTGRPKPSAVAPRIADRLGSTLPAKTGSEETSRRGEAARARKPMADAAAGTARPQGAETDAVSSRSTAPASVPAAAPAAAAAPPNAPAEAKADASFTASHTAGRTVVARTQAADRSVATLSEPADAVAGGVEGGVPGGVVGGVVGGMLGGVEEGDLEFRQLDAARPQQLADWRRLRDAWRDFATRYAEGPRADEARVRVVAAGLEAVRLGGRQDEATLRADAAAYLGREDARQKDRVRRLLASTPVTR